MEDEWHEMRGDVRALGKLFTCIDGFTVSISQIGISQSELIGRITLSLYSGSYIGLEPGG
jgi:hypothetical protein